MTLVLLLHLAVAVVVLATGRVVGARVALVAAGVAPAVGLVWAATQASDVLDGATPTQRWTWVEALDLTFSFRLDGFALLMALIVTGVGALVAAYAVPYFGCSEPPDRLVRYAGTYAAFAGSMLGLVLADDAWTLFVFWEATSITSFVLIGLHEDDGVARAAAQRALLITAAGGLALMGGLVLVGQEAGTTSFAAWAEAPPGGTAVEVGLVLVLLGAFTKSAQVPFHIWLPGAMAAPTPVSAYLHSATMVKAGIVLLARVGPVFGEVGWWRPVVVAVGVTTMLVGGVGALRQHDAKLLLAQGTVSQLGLLVVLLGVGDPAVTAAGVAVLLAHALFKSVLFLVVGAVDHATGTRDVRRLSGVGRSVPVLAGIGAVAAASMAGVPPLLGFVAKESALDALLHADGGWASVALAGVVLGSVLTVAYTLRWWMGVFTDAGTDPAEAATVHHAPAPGLVLPAAVLAVGLGGPAACCPGVAGGLPDRRHRGARPRRSRPPGPVGRVRHPGAPVRADPRRWRRRCTCCSGPGRCPRARDRRAGLRRRSRRAAVGGAPRHRGRAERVAPRVHGGDLDGGRRRPRGGPRVGGRGRPRRHRRRRLVGRGGPRRLHRPRGGGHPRLHPTVRGRAPARGRRLRGRARSSPCTERPTSPSPRCSSRPCRSSSSCSCCATSRRATSRRPAGPPARCGSAWRRRWVWPWPGSHWWPARPGPRATRRWPMRSPSGPTRRPVARTWST